MFWIKFSLTATRFKNNIYYADNQKARLCSEYDLQPEQNEILVILVGRKGCGLPVVIVVSWLFMVVVVVTIMTSVL